MSDQQMGKKMVEAEDLERFFEAYEEVTGQRLILLEGGERPDFIGARPSGQKIGIELMRPSHDHERVVWDRILAPDRQMTDFELLPAIYSVIEKKTLKSSMAGWLLPDRTVLVVKLVDYTFNSWAWLSESSLRGSFASTRFAEVWLADHTEWEAYRSVRLIGLHPAHHWGRRRQRSLEGMPY